jgi:HAD superfamily hydrolase (TIGR01549 family)
MQRAQPTPGIGATGHVMMQAGWVVPAAVSFDLDATLLDNSFIPDTIASCCCFVADRTGVSDAVVAAANAAAFRDYWPLVEEDWALGKLAGEAMIRDQLRAAGVRLALITNGASDTQRARLASLRMDEWFDVVVISGEVGAVKPDASVFAMAAQPLRVDGRALWHVGDNLATDVLGAVAAGHTAVWVNRDGAARTQADPAPHFEVTSLTELSDLIAP